MDVAQAIRSRYSCRDYSDKPIEPDKLQTVLEAARLAPSAKNLQDWRFVVITDAKTKKRLAAAANNPTFLETAGAIVVGCTVSDHVMRCGQAVGPIDVAIALEHMRAHKIGCIAVVDELGTAVGILTGFDVVVLAIQMLEALRTQHTP